MDYESYLRDNVNYIINSLKQQNLIDDEYAIEVANEQQFIKNSTYSTNKAYIVIKYLASSITFNTITQPIQIMILCEDNSMADSKLVFENFTTNYNWKVEKETTSIIKQQYNSPVVLSNFGEDFWGYKTLLYVSGSITKMNNVVDIFTYDSNNNKQYGKIKIDNVIYDYINATMSYQMTPNTQQLASEKIASSVRSLSTLGLTLIIPLTNNALTTKILNISVGAGNDNGNTDFAFNFNFDGTNSSVITYNGNMKLISCSVGSSSNDIPSISLSFMR